MTNRNLNKILKIFLLLLGCSYNAISQRNNPAADTTLRTEISQYGITWTFDRPAKTGRFITGDWWVLGPVTIVKITPAPGPVSYEKTILTPLQGEHTFVRERKPLPSTLS